MGPHRSVPSWGTKILLLALERLSEDRQARYSHGVWAVETFVDPEPFCGTVYTANGWQELDQTNGWGPRRCAAPCGFE